MEVNDNKDQKPRGWSAELIDSIKGALNLHDRSTVKSAEDAVNKLKERKGRA